MYFLGKEPDLVVSLEDGDTYTVPSNYSGYIYVNPGRVSNTTINAVAVASDANTSTSGAVTSGSPLSHTVSDGFHGWYLLSVSGTHTGLNITVNGASIGSSNGDYRFSANGGSVIAASVSTGTANYTLTRVGGTYSAGFRIERPVGPGDDLENSCTAYLWYLL